jgi:hypothetical protein
MMNARSVLSGLKHQKEKRSMAYFAGLDVSVKETSRHCSARLARQKGAISGCEQSQQRRPLFDHLVGAGEER